MQNTLAPSISIMAPSTHHLAQQLLLAALDALTDAALLGPVVVQHLAVADGHLALVGGRGALVTDGALWHAHLALEGRRLLERRAHATAGAPLDQGLEGREGGTDGHTGRAVRTAARGGGGRGGGEMDEQNIRDKVHYMSSVTLDA